MTVTAERPVDNGFGEPVSGACPPPAASGPVSRNSGRILATAGEVERLQWELDRAEEDLRAAILAGAADGMDVPALAFAAGATVSEIRHTLGFQARL